MDAVTFFAAGRPRTKGSTRSFEDPRTGRIVTKGDNRRTKAWQRVVGLCARAAGVELLPAVYLRVTFRFARPKKHYGTGRNAGVLKDSAQEHPTGRNIGDVEKLLRAVLDGLTGVAYKDDSDVVGFRDVCKRWAREGEEEGVSVTVTSAVPDWACYTSAS